MSGVLVTPAQAARTTRSRAVYDAVVQPQWVARIVDRVRHIGTPFTAIGATISAGPFDLTTRHEFAGGYFVPMIEEGCLLALAHALTEPAQEDEIAALFDEVRDRAAIAEFPTPSYSVVAQAGDWVRALARIATEWNAPHVTSSPVGEIVLEWWKDPRKLTIYVSDDTVDYVKSWGTSISNEMTEGAAPTPDQALALWNWLIRG